MSIPTILKPEDVLKIKDYIWICPPEFAQAFTFINEVPVPAFD